MYMYIYNCNVQCTCESKETRGHLQTGDVRNPTPLHERHGFMYSLVSGSLCGY